MSDQCYHHTPRGETTVWRGEQSISIPVMSRFYSSVLGQDLMRGLFEMGFDEPYIIQQHMLPVSLSTRRDNVTVFAPTKSGKSIACLIIALYWLTKLRSQKILIVHRSCDSAQKAHSLLNEMAKYMPGVDVRLAIRRHVGKIADNVIIGTPDKINVLIDDRDLNCETIGLIVFDEVGASDAVHRLLIRMGQELGNPCQLIWLSALENEISSESFLTRSILRYPTKIRCCYTEQSKKYNGTQKLKFVACRNGRENLDVLKLVASYQKQGIVVCKTNEDASELAISLKNKKWAYAGLLTGKIKNLRDRESLLEKFINGTIKVLVTTPHFLEEAVKADIGILVNYGVLMSKDSKFDPKQYQKRVEMLAENKNEVLVLSTVDGRWEPYICSDPNIELLEIPALQKLLSN